MLFFFKTYFFSLLNYADKDLTWLHSVCTMIQRRARTCYSQWMCFYLLSIHSVTIFELKPYSGVESFINLGLIIPV